MTPVGHLAIVILRDNRGSGRTASELGSALSFPICTPYLDGAFGSSRRVIGAVNAVCSTILTVNCNKPSRAGFVGCILFRGVSSNGRRSSCYCRHRLIMQNCICVDGGEKRSLVSPLREPRGFSTSQVL